VTRKAPLPATTKLPDSTSWPGVFSTGSASPVRSDSSISSSPPLEHAVSGELVARLDEHQVVLHHVGHGDGVHLAVPLHPRPGCLHQRQPGERPPGAQLLEDPDGGVQHEHDAEQGVLERTDDEDHRQQAAQDGVEAGEDVGPEDVGDAAAGAFDLAVDQPPARPVRGTSAEVSPPVLGAVVGARSTGCATAPGSAVT